jgi:hypothetical protein
VTGPMAFDMHMDASPPADLAGLRQRALVVGAVALGVCVLGALASPEQFFRSYLVGYLLWFGVALGCLPLVMLHHQTGGAWGLAIRRLLEASTRTLPLMAVLFLPVAVGVGRLYLWAQPGAAETDAVLAHKAIYLNVPFFLGRAVLYFVVWFILAYFLNHWSREQDRTADGGLARRMQLLSGPGIALYGLTVTFASIDWVMSLDPHWFSTIYGMLFMTGQGVTALAFTIGALAWLSDRRPLSAVASADIFHDLGKLLLAFVMVWAYLSFSQFLIIWSGNLVEEIPFYLRRLSGGWAVLGTALVLFHFALPFALLLSRDLKRSSRTLAAVAAGVFVMRFVDLFWMITPNFAEHTFHVHWMDVAAPLGIGGLWIAAFLGQLAGRPLLPMNDPYLEEAFGDGAH